MLAESANPEKEAEKMLEDLGKFGACVFPGMAATQGRNGQEVNQRKNAMKRSGRTE